MVLMKVFGKGSCQYSVLGLTPPPAKEWMVAGGGVHNDMYDGGSFAGGGMGSLEGGAYNDLIHGVGGGLHNDMYGGGSGSGSGSGVHLTAQ